MKIFGKYILIFVTIFFTSCTLPSKQQPTVEKGFIDLSRYNFKKDGVIHLNGDWEFYWEEFYQPSFFKNQSQKHINYYPVPSIWNHQKYKGKNISPHGFATYRVRISLPSEKMKLAFKIKTLGTAYQLYLDGQLLTKGKSQVGKSKRNSIPAYVPLVVDFQNNTQEVDLVIHISNFHHRKGGFWESIQLGLEEDIRQEQLRDQLIDFLILGVILIMTLYHLSLFWIRRKTVSALYFSLLCCVTIVRILVTGDYPINLLLDMNWFLIIHLEYLSTNLGPLSLIWFLYALFPEEVNPSIPKFSTIIFGCLISIILIFPPQYFTYTVPISQILIFCTGIYAIYILVKAITKNKKDAIVFSTGFLILFLVIINDILYTNGILNTGNQFAIGIFFFIIFQSIALSYRFAKAFKESEMLFEKLGFINKNLERIIRERTDELQVTNEQLNQNLQKLDSTHQILMKQKSLSDKKNQDFTDSTRYASNIQKALLPTPDYIQESIHQYFILYKPKDIVSGDFYWFHQFSDGKFIIAAVDCTGHGVPGAMMSILGIESLNKIIIQNNNQKADVILTELDAYIRKTLRQQLNNLRDGMDLALCVIDPQNKTLEFSGAHNPMIIIQEGQSKIVKGSPKSIGGIVTKKIFEVHQIDISIPTHIYIFSDGYQDQFGGKEQRKFMKSRLRKLITENHQKPMEDQKRVLEETIKQWMIDGKESQLDDILIIGMKLKF